jgi:hypothetical protein
MNAVCAGGPAAASAPRPGVIDTRPLVCVLIFIALFAGCQGGRYFMANRLQELGIACALALFALGGWRAMFRIDFATWRTWMLMPACLILGVMGISSLVFYLNFGGNALYSFFSARELLLGFVGPGIFLLCRAGFPVARVEATLRFTIVALMVNYLFFYFTMDLRAAFFSSDHTVSNLVTYDEWRGFRLKPPLFPIMVGLMAAFIGLLQARGLRSAIGALLILGLAIYIWSIVMFRSTLATMLLAMLLYPLFLRSRNRLPMVIALAPLALLMAPALLQLMLDVFLGADGGNIRLKAFQAALDHIPRHPLFGAGEDNAYGATYQDIVAPYFFPDDIGLVGTVYKYGLVGAALYLFMHFRIWQRLWAANIHHLRTAGRISPLLWGLLIWLTALTFNLVLNPGLAYAQGVTLASTGFALATLQLQGCR